MPDTKQINTRLPEVTRKQLEWLVSKLGATVTQVLIIAIDRLAREEGYPQEAPRQ